MSEACPKCGKPAVRSGPAKYSPDDPYGAYRRKLKVLVRGESP